MANFFYRFLSKVRDSLASAVYNRLAYDQFAFFLRQQSLSSSVSGITTERLSNTEVIVSLTTHGQRIYEVYLAIESIMQGSIKPNRIILWLSQDDKDHTIPQMLKNQESRGLEIRYTNDIGPYTKSIPSFLAFPDAAIVTIDDDILYPYDTLEMLLHCHQQHPQCICANRILDLTFDKQGNPNSLPSLKELTDKTRISSQNFFEGVGSVLYPPRCFPKEDLNPAVFQPLCPTSDDVWMNVLALHHKVAIIPANHHYHRFPLVINESVQDSALWRHNNGKDNHNDLQFSATLRHFGILV